MADDSAWDVFLVQTRELKRYSIAAAVVILYYDYILTVVTEYNLYWVKSRLSWTSFLFFLNRYAALVAHIPAIIQSFWEISDDTLVICLHPEHMIDIDEIGVVLSSGSVKSIVRSLSQL
ncbi:hypothetical protein QCA50_013723 [Cerrena zonata]|uniref:DUF6533 domain-containing protein n=1 Tax=Cerrena zonata TaxID=2478898 RepID=A0AAW0FQA8_9APHY